MKNKFFYLFIILKMVFTRNQKRKNEIDIYTNKKRKREETETEIEESESEEEEESEEEIEDLKSESESESQLNEQILINNISKKLFKTLKKNTLKKNKNEYKNFYNLKETILSGDFFERIPIEDDIKKLKDTFTLEEIKNFTNQLESIKENYQNNTPSIIDILKMNISTEQKQKLLEKFYSLANSEILSTDYNYNLKFLNSNISNNNPELLQLEEQILKYSVNNGMSDTYKTKILKSEMSFENKVIAYKKLEIMESYEDSDTSEYAKYKNWIDNLLSIPFGIYNKQDHDIKNVRLVLDKKLSFLEKPKDRIINIVSHMIRNPNVNINPIGLYGSAGVGKTAVAHAIAESLNRPFKMISLGGENDSTYLTGHSFTYVGSNPGRLIEILKDCKTMNPVILFDELDKLSSTSLDIIGTLIHLTDTTTNFKFNHDKYFAGIEFDLSKILFIFTYNDPSKIDKILANRLFKIKVDNYSFEEKLEITKKHLINSILEKFNFNKKIIFNDDAIKYIISNSNDAGMRTIKSKINIIISRINTLLLTKPEDNIINLKYKKLHNYYQESDQTEIIILKDHVDILLDESITDTDADLSSVPFGMYI